MDGDRRPKEDQKHSKMSSVSMICIVDLKDQIAVDPEEYISWLINS